MDAGADGAVATDGGPVVTPHDFVVQYSGDSSPAAAATVYVDLDGARTSYTTAADGTFTASVDWSSTVAVTVDVTGLSLVTYVLTEADAETLREASGATRLTIYGNPPTDRVTVGGTITGFDDASHGFAVAADVAGATSYTDNATDWEIQVPRGVPCRLTALEFTSARTGPLQLEQTIYRAVVVDLDALDADATVDLDLSTSLELHTASGTMELPESLATAPVAYASVQRQRFLGLFGYMTSLAPQAPGSRILDYTITWIEPPGADDPLVQYFVQDGTRTSVVILDGWPAGGALPAMLDVPTIVSPTFGTPHPLHDPIVFGPGEPTAGPGLLLRLEGEPEIVWAVFGATGTRTLEVPATPPGREGIFPTGASVVAQPRWCELGPDPFSHCAVVAFGESIFDLVP